MTDKQQQAKVWLWLAHMAHTEADAIAYAWPRPLRWAEEVEINARAADSCIKRAERALGGEIPDELWAHALESFGTP